MAVTESTLIHGCRLVVNDQCLEGWLRVADGRITQVEAGAPRFDDDHDEVVLDLSGQWLVPGFVDLHVHGGNGASYGSGDLDSVQCAANFHRRHGTTTTLASVVAAPVEDMLAAVGSLAEFAADRLIAGIHIEGPFLSPQRRGAQNPMHLCAPDPGVLARLLNAGKGYVRVVTVAPELDGGVDLVRRIVDRGAVAAVGHTDATYAEARKAFHAGARLATHLFNGMRPLLSREGGAVGAALNEPDVVVEIVNDGVHVSPAIVSIVTRLTKGRLAFVTDAMAAAGVGDGIYPLGDMQVRVADGIATLVDGSSIAGSTLTMDAALRRAVLDEAMPMAEAVSAVSATPARLLGRPDVGSLAPGNTADLVVLDQGLRVARVMVGGEWQDDES
jgi:N-acetylglucosamine-6-phosphate deacetylase